MRIALIGLGDIARIVERVRFGGQPRHQHADGQHHAREHQDELDPLAETAEADRRGEKTQSDKAAQIKSGFG